MRSGSKLRRVGAALLAVALLGVGFAGAAHAHPIGNARDIQWAADAAVPAAIEVGCGLCASSARLGHGAAEIALATQAPELRCRVASRAPDAALPSVSRPPGAPRAPPRQG